MSSKKSFNCFDLITSYKCNYILKEHSWHVFKMSFEGIPYPCDRCDYATNIQSAMDRHIQVKHFVRCLCKDCAFSALSEARVDRHKEECHVKHKDRSHGNSSLDQTRGETHQCDECDFSTIYLNGLRIHKGRGE